jgi:3-hydroxyisobutyrate dehydrogenase-like beta-hydroxyacid dehydrogenase
MTEGVGFIGLGVMGRPMALHLLRAGHALNVYARRQEAMQPTVDAGATACASPGEVASRSDVVFTMVTTGADVEQVVLGAKGIVESARPGLTVVDTSTIPPAVARRIAAHLDDKGVAFLDAPVSGGEVGAVNATLSIMVGGSEAAFARVEPLLRAFGKTVLRIGSSGDGQVAKAATQLAIVLTLQGIAEAITLARANGVDAARVLKALLGGSAYSRMLEVMGPRMVSGDFRPGVEARLHHKDALIALQCAADAGIAVPGAAVAAQSFNALMARGGAKLDSAAVITVIEAMRGS